MESTSLQWSPALAAPHRAQIRVEVWDRGQLIDGNLPIIDGAVTDQWVTGTRRSLSLTVPSTPPIRELLKTPLIELRPYRGINFGSGTPEMLPLGRFPVTFDSDDADPTQPIQITAGDHWQTVVADTFYGPTVSGTGLIRDEITRLISETSLGATSSTVTSPALMTLRMYESGRHEAISDLCEAIGVEAFVDRSGTAVLRDRVAATTPAYHVTAGQDGTMVSAAAQRDWLKVYNILVVIPTATNVAFTPEIVAITDTNDPAHPARIGRRVYQWQTPLVADPVQARSAGAVKLAKLSAPQRSLSVSCVPNVALDAGDAIGVTFPDGTYETAQIEQINHPLTSAGVQQITTVSSRTDET